ncbi:LacI family transcriptional regulator [Ruminococcaceae bacterium OttesenSCG-928-L11]|nr:LacI family transcriptional regulator [Ruminococcaceae bacterium OttesenSCG-928-L11]
MLIATIKEVAKAAGVSVATVSRVLNNDRKVADRTRVSVEDAIQRLNYRPNLLGRNLRLQQTRMILVILSSISNNFHAKIIRSIENEGRLHGYNIMLCATHDDRKIEAAYLELLKNKMADGIIFLSTTLTALEMKELGRDYPIIQCGEYYEGIDVPIVSVDNEMAAFTAVSHLAAIGRKRIAHITVSNDIISTRLRLSGYMRALKENNLPYSEHLVAYARYGYGSAYAAMENLLSHDTKPDAVFAISDRMAAGAIKCTIDKGLQVPGDIAVAGFDNTDITPIYNPSITTMSQSEQDMGAAAMRILVERIGGSEEIPFRFFKYSLIVRDSTDPTHTEQ